MYDADNVGVYHVVQRCVGRAFLCGSDSISGSSYGHRCEWIQARLEFLSGVFAVDVLDFAVMINLLHVVVRNRPDDLQKWSVVEVAKRWRRLFPQRHDEDDGSPLDATNACFGKAASDHSRCWMSRRSQRAWLMWI